jgi:hypothetical protein
MSSLSLPNYCGGARNFAEVCYFCKLKRRKLARQIRELLLTALCLARQCTDDIQHFVVNKNRASASALSGATCLHNLATKRAVTGRQ